ncbi:hypothetical protein F511_32168 [Dorcoceras hygrometricum]|uniref:Uncharacterized protein n=1 Tax=Dorcoceras hygrometricum TaxID=472368 RepID=A0A2Z7BEH0_9LAMI|nr:hypothetical protein F511_32168 [Dorcoceras hygrometricum]
MLSSLNLSKVYEQLSTSDWRFQLGDQYFMVSSTQVEPQIVSDIREAQRTDPYVHELKSKARSAWLPEFPANGQRRPNKTKAENKYEVKPQYEELSKQINMQHAIINAMNA